MAGCGAGSLLVIYRDPIALRMVEQERQAYQQACFEGEMRLDFVSLENGLGLEGC
jgi:hypothetical protein